jgi:hypothetical protein
MEYLNLSLREAEISDVDAITAICLAAMPASELWHYRYCNAVQYPEDHHKYTRERFRIRTDKATRGDFLVLVVEALENDVPAIVGYSVWQGPDASWAVGPSKSSQRRSSTPQPSDPAGGPSREVSQSFSLKDSGRMDADPARLQAWRETTARVKREVFDANLGRGQLDLIQRAVLPAYQKRGIGTFMLKWACVKLSSTPGPLHQFALRSDVNGMRIRALGY